jgi:hypothetical protein
VHAHCETYADAHSDQGEPDADQGADIASTAAEAESDAGQEHTAGCSGLARRCRAQVDAACAAAYSAAEAATACGDFTASAAGGPARGQGEAACAAARDGCAAGAALVGGDHDVVDHRTGDRRRRRATAARSRGGFRGFRGRLAVSRRRS